MKHSDSIAFALASLLLTAACTVGPDYEAPTPDVAAAWRDEPGPGLAAGPAELAGWWRHLGDPLLDSLIERAAVQSLDVRESLARVQEARALRGIAQGERLPAVDGRAGYERRGGSDNTPLGEFVPDSDLYSLGFDAIWELDLWGRLQRSIEAADADLAATIEDARDIAVTVMAEVARSYVELRSFQVRSAIARHNVELQEETLALVQARFDSGLVNGRDVAQARANVANTRARVPALEAQERAAENRLAVLLGIGPGELAAELAEPRPVPVPTVAVAVGVPADLLRRRADVRRAERELAAEHARIGAAQAELYPQLTLSGMLGLASEQVGDLLKSSSGEFSIGPSLRWNLFDGGRRKNRVTAQEARTEQAFVRWERTVLVALEETENSLTAFVREQARHGSLAEAADQARVAVELARTQYVEGLSDFQSVLDSERSVAVLEDELATSDAAIATHLVALYKALGGGWEGS